MMKALNIGATGMIAQERELHTISNNLSNVNTFAFKKDRNHFQDLLYHQTITPGTETSVATAVPVGLQQGYGVKHVATQKQFTQGTLSHTENELDLSIDGDGFFMVRMPNNQIAYTRDGAWSKDINGRIVTADGYPLEPQVVIPQNATKISIGERGVVQIFFDGVVEPDQIGNIQLAQFINPQGLNPVGKNLFTQSASSGNPAIADPGEQGNGLIGQGFIELSNVSLVEEMVGMISAQRAYEANSKSIRTSDSMLDTAVNLIRS
ncbi:MAG: flagellar basal-body rod protein FlgG [SAR324 cluster bacterium]|nr:flagellar basal-body rod protein FlgG [SAR324 cluster bacterium]